MQRSRGRTWPPWPRGGGKSTTLETASVAWGARRRRRFVLVVRETQKQANESVRNISSKLDGEAFGAAYPEMARRALNRFGHSKGYTQQQLRTASGFKVAGLGLDAAGRGIKFDDDRPDAILFDDLDARHDSPAATRKKIETITETVLPMGTPGCVVVYGVVLALDELDDEKDTIDRAEIEKAAYAFMLAGRTQQIDADHDGEVKKGFVAESWIVRQGDPLFVEEPKGGVMKIRHISFRKETPFCSVYLRKPIASFPFLSYAY